MAVHQVDDGPGTVQDGGYGVRLGRHFLLSSSANLWYESMKASMYVAVYTVYFRFTYN